MCNELYDKIRSAFNISGKYKNNHITTVELATTKLPRKCIVVLLLNIKQESNKHSI